MVDKIKKIFQKMSPKEKLTVKLVVQQAYLDHNKVPNLKKLNGYKDLYRIRVGRFRIILKISKKLVKITQIKKRDDNTYKNI